MATSPRPGRYPCGPRFANTEQALSTASKISVVVLSHGERAGIAEWLNALRTILAEVPHEVLICYGSDAAPHGLADVPGVQLVRSTRGNGSGHALRAGLEAARGDVVVTTNTADLARPADVLRLAEHARREGLAVVVCTPDASLSKHDAGLGALNSPSEFRAYSRGFLDAVLSADESSSELAIQLALKARTQGRRVGELALDASGRPVREDRLRPWNWSAVELQQRARSAWQPAIVWLVAIVMSITAWNYIADGASRVPVWDDMEFVPLIHPEFHWTANEAWALHNEHRIPLPRIIGSSVYKWTHDIRTMMYIDLVLLIGLSLAMMLVARKIRGRTTLVDAVFPLLWLHTGNSENLLMGFQVALILPTVLVSAMTMIAISRPRTGLTWREAIVFGLCLLSLPLCGGPGITQAPPIAVGLAASVFFALRKGDRQQRSGAVWTTLFLALLGGLFVLYMIGFVYPDNSARSSDPMLIMGAAIRVATLVFGEAGRAWWPWSGYAILSLVAITLVLLFGTWRKQVGERWRVVALVFSLGAISMLVLAIGYGRSGGGTDAGFATRYITLPSPLIAVAAFAWILYGGRVGRVLVPGALAVLLLAANYFQNTPAGAAFASARKEMGHEIEADLKGGMQPAAFLDKWTDRIYSDRGRLYYLLTRMAGARTEPANGPVLKLAPFDELPDELRVPYTWFMYNLPPARVEGPVPLGRRFIDGAWEVMVAQTGTDVYFDAPAKYSRLSGSFGMLPREIALGKTPGVRVKIQVLYGDGSERETPVDITLDPVRNPQHRTGQLINVALKPHERCQVVLSVTWPDGVAHEPDWAFFGDLGFQ